MQAHTGLNLTHWQVIARLVESKSNANQAAFSKGTSENINTENFINYFEETYPVLDLL